MVSRSENSDVGAYDPVTIAFHWVTAILVVALFTLALFPGVVKGSIDLHRTIGLSLLVVVVLRLLWRLTMGRKRQPLADEPMLLRLGAMGAHWALYGLLLVTPLLGLLYQDAKGIDVHFLGMELPMINYYDRELAMWIYDWKKVVAYSLLALILLHAGAALVYHAHLRKDGVLRSMLPRRWRAGNAA